MNTSDHGSTAPFVRVCAEVILPQSWLGAKLWQVTHQRRIFFRKVAVRAGDSTRDLARTRSVLSKLNDHFDRTRPSPLLLHEIAARLTDTVELELYAVLTTETATPLARVLEGNQIAWKECGPSNNGTRGQLYTFLLAVRPRQPTDQSRDDVLQAVAEEVQNALAASDFTAKGLKVKVTATDFPYLVIPPHTTPES